MTKYCWGEDVRQGGSGDVDGLGGCGHVLVGVVHHGHRVLVEEII